MFQVKCVSNLLFYVALIFAIQFADSRRLSFKESLTAYAEKSSEDVQSFQNEKNEKDATISHHSQITIPSLMPSVGEPNYNGTHNQKPQDVSSLSPIFGLLPTSTSNGEQFSLWKLTKNFLSPLQPFISSASSHNMTAPLVPYIVSANKSAEQYPLASTIFRKPDINQNNGHQSSEKSDGPNQPRNKKEVASNPGLQELLWNTATALWSVNKEHFLPTFLHTKTGGKLSLVRESIFKPITILSQYKSGVQQINNEKLQSLARLHTGNSGWGWSKPVEQPENTHLMTLAKYVFSLSKHTVVTKYKLKRALIDLQLRAVKKFIRILRSKNLAQKIATIRILANAALKGKKAAIQIIKGSVKTTAAPAPYPGKDNSGNVDLTYSSLNKYNNGQAWKNYVNPPKNPAYNSPVPHPPVNTYDNFYTSTYNNAEPPPPPPNTYSSPYKSTYSNAAPLPRPSNTYDNYYTSSYNNAEPPPHVGKMPVPSSVFLPPAPIHQQAFARTSIPPENITFTIAASNNHYHQLPSTTPQPLIETPSYSIILKTMGINPNNLETTISGASTNAIASHPTTSITPESPKSPTPTVVYFQSTDNQEGQTDVTNTPYKINDIEQPSVSIEYHTTTSLQPTTNDSKSYAATTPRTSFGMKLLDAMNKIAGKRV